MKKKQLIMICAAVLCVLVILFVMSAVSGKPGREQTAAEPQSVSEQTENNGATEQESTTEPDEKNTETETRRETSTKATTQVAPQNPAHETAAENTAGAAEKKETTQKQKITVTFSVSCKNALSYGADVPQSGYIIGQTQLTLKQGQTVFDALEAACEKNGVSLRYQSKSYITGIGGLNEKDCGGASGWMYRVNGENPMKGASKYTLQDGDVVEWYYVTSASDR